ncbi:MAG: adenylate/guanylate cyclase domain-containing protein [Bacteroidota bacterium]
MYQLHRFHLLLLWLLLLGSSPALMVGQTISVPQNLRHQLAEARTPQATCTAMLAMARYFERRQPDSAYSYAHQALELATNHHLRSEEQEALNRLGDLRYGQGAYPEASEHYFRLLRLARTNEDRRGVARALERLGHIDYRFGNYPEAIEFQLEALQIRSDLKDSLEMADSYYAIGILQAEMGNYQQARSYYQQALELVISREDLQRQANILNMVGRTWRKQNIFDKALATHARSFALYSRLGDELGMSDYYNNVGSIYRRQGKYETALEYFFKALKIQQQLGDQEGMADGLNDIGTTYTQMGQYEKGIQYLQQALSIAQATGLKDDVRYAYASLSAAHDSLGDSRRAMDFYILATNLRDSLVNQSRANQLNQLQTKHQLAEQAQQIALLKQQRALVKSQQEVSDARTRQTLIILGAFLLILGIFGGFMLWRSRLQSQLNRKLAAKNRTIEAERKKSENLLHNILPVSVAEELKASRNNQVKARSFDSVSVLFTDFRGFSKQAANMTPQELVADLDECFRGFDQIMLKHGLEKIKTIGDAYMCASGLPVTKADHAVRTVQAALDMQTFMIQLKEIRQAEDRPFFEARLGIHSGPVVAGVVGQLKFAYDIWGDTVNTAARMESRGRPGKVNISQATFELVKDHFEWQHRGKVKVKHGIEIDMYFVLGPT